MDKILLSHGSGGSLMHKLIRQVLLKKFNNPILNELADSARLKYKDNLAFTTDSFVVSPLNFPGGDIGKLAVCGTVNDLVMLGAVPEYLSLALIVEEGLELKVLEKITSSISFWADKAGVKIVTGDFKVVERGACDKIYINTSGVGKIISERNLSMKNISAGDEIIITGEIAQHGFAVLSERKGLNLGLGINSDCAPLNNLLVPLLKKTADIKFMRDPTRGGLATTLNEVTQATKMGIVINEKSIPLSKKVRVAGELLGIDPMYVANEGKAVLIVKKDSSKKILRMLKEHALGRNASIIGEVMKSPKQMVILNTAIGSQRVLDMQAGELMPRIC